MVSLSWHPRNPKTGGDAWDVSDHAVVKSILPEGENYEKFQSWLGKVNDFILSLKTSDGTKIPVLFVLGTNTPEVGSGGDRIYVPRMNTRRYGE